MTEKSVVKIIGEEPKKEESTHYCMASWICLATIGSIYAMSETPSLHDYWKSYFQQGYGDKFEFYYNLAQSISLFALVFLSFIIGVLSDMYSNGILMIIQSAVIVVGQFLVILAYRFGFFWCFFIGRILVFLSMQTIQTSSKAFLNQHVADKEKGFLFGVHSSCVLVGKCVVLLLQPFLATKYGLQTAIEFTFLLTCFSLFSSMMTYYLEVQLNRQNQQYNQFDTESQLDQSESTQELQQLQNNQQQQRPSQWEEIKAFDNKFWYYGFIIAASLLVTNVVDALLPAYLSSYWKIETLEATQIASICTFYGFFNWLMGLIYDYLKLEHEWLLFSSFASLVGQILLTQYHPVIGTIILGLGYNMRVIAMFPLLNKFVKKECSGKAYGLIRSFKDFISMFAFLSIGFIVDSTGSYQSSFQGVYVFIVFYTLVNLKLYYDMKKQKHE